MKKIFSLLVLVAAFAGSINAQTTCEEFYAMKAGRKMTQAHYNDKNKLTGYTKAEVVAVNPAGNGLVADMKLVTTNEKGKEEATNEFQIKCADGQLLIDMKSRLSAQSMQQMEGMENMEMTIESDDIIAPIGGTPGQTLPDASFTMKASMNGMSLMNMKMRIYDRKVEAIESMTTPAGTYTCVKMTESFESSMGFATFKGKSVSWFNPQVGMVRIESYNDKGVLTNYEVLEKFE